MIELRFMDGVLQTRDVSMPVEDRKGWRAVPRGGDLVDRAADSARIAQLVRDVHYARTTATQWKAQACRLDAMVTHLGKTAGEWFAIAKKRKADGNWLAAEMRSYRSEHTENLEGLRNFLKEHGLRNLAELVTQRDALRKALAEVTAQRDLFNPL